MSDTTKVVCLLSGNFDRAEQILLGSICLSGGPLDWTHARALARRNGQEGQIYCALARLIDAAVVFSPKPGCFEIRDPQHWHAFRLPAEMRADRFASAMMVPPTSMVVNQAGLRRGNAVLTTRKPTDR